MIFWTNIGGVLSKNVFWTNPPTGIAVTGQPSNELEHKTNVTRDETNVIESTQRLTSPQMMSQPERTHTRRYGRLSCLIRCFLPHLLCDCQLPLPQCLVINLIRWLHSLMDKLQLSDEQIGVIANDVNGLCCCDVRNKFWSGWIIRDALFKYHI